MIRKILLSFALVCFMGTSFVYAEDCSTLISKYKAPDPSKKTMAQLKRWVSRKLENNADAHSLETCLVAQAADNPNKDQVAGK